MQDNAGANSSKEINKFSTLKGVMNYFSIPYEQWQNGLCNSSIKYLLMLTKTELAESCLARRFWFSHFSATIHVKNCRNATFKKRVGTTQHAKIFGRKKDVSKFKPFGCRTYVHLKKKQREPGKHAPGAVKALHLGLASD
jgi:hypothetical protein